MLTNDKTITTPDYWNRIYAGQNHNAKVDASNTKREADVFDRFQWVADKAEGPWVLGVASGHAHIEKRIRAKNKTWWILATDQAAGAKEVAKFKPYEIMDAYNLPKPRDYFAGTGQSKWNTIIIAQAMEYLDRPEAFMREAQRVADKILMTVPIGEMGKWSQLRIYTQESLINFLEPYGEIQIFERQGEIALAKLKFIQ